jgi:hypothetical protein
MKAQQIIDAQWQGYAERHRKPGHLLLKVLAVALFWVASFEVLGAVLLMLMGVPLAFRMLFWAAVLIGVSLGIQAAGRSLEGVGVPAPGNAGDFVKSTLIEQFVTFPRFVVTGAWLRNLKGG